MRPGQQNKRGRGRGNNNNNGNGNNFNRKGQNPLTRTYDSSGPDVKIRGTAQHIAEKYAALARDAQSSGDRVMAENYLQHAEHYNRIIAAAQAQMQERFQRDDRNDYGDDMDGNDGADMADGAEGSDDGEQPQIQPVAREERQPREDRQPREERQPRREREHNRDRDGNREQRDHNRDRNRDRNAGAQPPVAQPQPVIDDSTPQPVIEGTPVEVAMEAPEGDATPRAAATRRRGPATRPRRQPRNAEGDAAPADAAPALADSE